MALNYRPLLTYRLYISTTTSPTLRLGVNQLMYHIEDTLVSGPNSYPPSEFFHSRSARGMMEDAILRAARFNTGNYEDITVLKLPNGQDAVAVRDRYTGDIWQPVRIGFDDVVKESATKWVSTLAYVWRDDLYQDKPLPIPSRWKASHSKNGGQGEFELVLAGYGAETRLSRKLSDICESPFERIVTAQEIIDRSRLRLPFRFGKNDLYIRDESNGCITHYVIPGVFKTPYGVENKLAYLWDGSVPTSN